MKYKVKFEKSVDEWICVHYEDLHKFSVSKLSFARYNAIYNRNNKMFQTKFYNWENLDDVPKCRKKMFEYMDKQLSMFLNGELKLDNIKE